MSCGGHLHAKLAGEDATLAVSVTVSSAIESWKAALGDDAVSDLPETLARYARTTSPRPATQPACILYPRTTEQVQEIVRIANAHGTTLYPISRGRNWGYGDACAPTDQAAIVDLSRMNQIVELDRELGYAVIEPGVTQRQFYEHVHRHAPEYWVDCTGAGDEASLVGNILDRGFGHTPYGDHIRSSCGMEVVLPDARVLQTGFGHFPGARASRVFPYGVGPQLDGLFVQSCLGIVTKACVWLYPAPDAINCFYIKVDDEEALWPLIDALRPLRMNGTLNSAVHIGNDLRVISSHGHFPWEASGGKAPLPHDLRLRLRHEAGVGAWNITGSITGTHRQVREAARALRRVVGRSARVIFLNDWRLAAAGRLASALQFLERGRILARQVEALLPNYGLLKGIPTNVPLMGTQWRLRHPAATPPEDPLDTPCGLIWISPVLPMRGADAQRVQALVEPIFAHYGFDCLATFTLLNERAMVAVLNISFDKTVPAECDAAEACYKALLGALLAEGYVPYRTGLAGMPALAAKGDVFWETAQQIKQALDPHSTIAPGRYIPSPNTHQ
jgi:4-cresol dehydrogenase (hydroxylating)